LTVPSVRLLLDVNGERDIPTSSRRHAVTPSFPRRRESSDHGETVQV